MHALMHLAVSSYLCFLLASLKNQDVSKMYQKINSLLFMQAKKMLG